MEKKLSRRENIYCSKDFRTTRADISGFGGMEGMETVFIALVRVFFFCFFFLLTFQKYCLSFAKSADGRILAVAFRKGLELNELGPVGWKSSTWTSVQLLSSSAVGPTEGILHFITCSSDVKMTQTSLCVYMKPLSICAWRYRVTCASQWAPPRPPPPPNTVSIGKDCSVILVLEFRDSPALAHKIWY